MSPRISRPPSKITVIVEHPDAKVNPTTYTFTNIKGASLASDVIQREPTRQEAEESLRMGIMPRPQPAGERITMTIEVAR